MADRVGQQVGNYRLIQLLGTGGFAEVYLGEHQFLKTQAAIKVLHARLGAAEQEGFHEEARTIARLEHPHILRVLEYGVEGKTPFLVMDYAPNGTLRQRHPRNTPVPLETLRLYVPQIASALQCAHDAKLVHRDVKPANLLLGHSNEILLSDFGIAVVAHSTRSQKMQAIAGTITYMAPEQSQGKPRPASDQYSLAVTLYEWLTGDRLFRGNYAEMASQHLLTPPPPLRQKVPSIPPGVEEVVLTALAKDPKQRFASMRAFATAFEAACQQGNRPTSGAFQSGPVSSPLSRPTGTLTPTITPVLSGPFVTPEEDAPSVTAPAPMSLEAVTDITEPTPEALRATPGRSGPLTETFNPAISAPIPTPRQKGMSRRAVVVGLAGLVGLAASGGGAIYWVRSRSSLFASPPQPTPFPGTALTTYRGHTGAVNGVAWSPNGNYVASAGIDQTVQVWEARTGKKIATYTGHSGAVQAVAWSPDGKLLASASVDKTVQVWEALTAKPMLTYSGHTQQVLTVGWSPDGKQLASAGADMQVHIWNAEQGTLQQTFRDHTLTVTCVAWSPDGRRIASASADQTVAVRSVVTGFAVSTFTGHKSGVLSVAWSPDGNYLISSDGASIAQVWEVTTAVGIYTNKTHQLPINAVAWAPAPWIALASADQTVEILDGATFALALTYQGHTSSVSAVAWAPDGNTVASAGENVQVWRVT